MASTEAAKSRLLPCETCMKCCSLKIGEESTHAPNQGFPESTQWWSIISDTFFGGEHFSLEVKAATTWSPNSPWALTKYDVGMILPGVQENWTGNQRTSGRQLPEECDGRWQPQQVMPQSFQWVWLKKCRTNRP